MIGIDGNEANVNERVGSNVYAHKILTGLSESADLDSVRVYLKQAPLAHLPLANQQWQYRVLGNVPLWTQWRLPLDLVLNQPRPDIFFTPGHYAPRFSPVPSVITILDLAFLYFPQAFKPKVLKQLTAWTKYSVEQASHILTISQHSKKDIAKTYHIPEDKISVTYLASDKVRPLNWSEAERKRIMAKFAIPTKYFLFVGTRQPRKNLDLLVKAFNKLHATERNISLVIAGKVWHQFASQQLATHPQIVVTGYVSDTDLVPLILGSEALVYPSLYEGFGLPVLDAMQLGSLVAASNASSIPEITGNSPLLFDPSKQEQITAVLAQILKMKPDQKKKIVREGKIKARQFSWSKTVNQTKAVLQSIK